MNVWLRDGIRKVIGAPSTVVLGVVSIALEGLMLLDCTGNCVLGSKLKRQTILEMHEALLPTRPPSEMQRLTP